MTDMWAQFTMETDREEDGRWIAEVVELPGVLVYGTTREDAVERAWALAAEVIADRAEHGEGSERRG
jgi:predicted RNase H-like HicB family nuclease